MVVAGVVLAILVALARGGKLERLGELGLRGLPLVLVAIVMRYSAAVLVRMELAWALWLQVAAYVVFLSVIALNFTVPGIKTFGAGTLMNFLAIAANGGAMPVSAKAIELSGQSGTPTGLHTLIGEQTRLWFLSDIIPVPVPLPQRGVISIGDVLIIAGIFAFIQYRMLTKPKIQGLVLENE